MQIQARDRARAGYTGTAEGLATPNHADLCGEVSLAGAWRAANATTPPPAPITAGGFINAAKRMRHREVDMAREPETPPTPMRCSFPGLRQALRPGRKRCVAPEGALTPAPHRLTLALFRGSSDEEPEIRKLASC